MLWTETETCTAVVHREFLSSPSDVATAPLMEGKPTRRPSSASPSKPTGQDAAQRVPSLGLGHFPDPAKEGNMGWYCGALYWNCLQYVDAYFDEVIECECVSSLNL